MIKLSSYALATALLSRNVKAACPTTDFTVSLTAGQACNYDNLILALPADCTVGELFPAAAGNETTIRAEVDELCQYDAPTQFVEAQGTYQLDRRYFAGGGPFVDGDDWNIDSGDVKRFEENLGSKTLIAWPEYAARMQYNIDNGLGMNGYPTNMNLETSCALQTAMCCFTDTHASPFPAGATTDVCRHDLSNSPQSNHIKYGWSVFPGPETPTYCVGMTWNDGDDELIGNVLYDISLRQTINHGYRAGVPGAPMCGCIEHMPIVEKASCRTATKNGLITYSFTVEYGVDAAGAALPPYVSASNSVGITYADCANPDLAGQFVANGGDAAAIGQHLVGANGCAADLTEYLNDNQFLHEGQHPTKYLTPDPTKWTDLVVGEGIRFQPPAIDPEVADGEFRAMIDAGCKNSDGTGRYCIIRRVCDSCRSPSHRDIYYKRLTQLPDFGTNTTAGEVYLLDMFMNNFNNIQNEFGPNGDDTGAFQLFSTYEDAKAGTNPWTYCRFAAPGSNYGFPFECGPTGRVWDDWNSYIHVGRFAGFANHHGFYVEKPEPVVPGVTV